MTYDSIANETEDDLLRTLVTVMRELESSVEDSRKALLALDLAGIERGTQDHLALVRKIDSLLQRRRTIVAGGRFEGTTSAGFPSLLPELDEELRQSQMRISDALRLQSALLVRARHKLRVLANMLAGPARPYGPPPAQNSGLTNSSARQLRRENLESCRA